ncbi:MAG: type IV toxin-antitoxin system AbiEi family antitoxin domain-containing protein [Thermoplasmata archaeon]|nr:MAG: type IV toxin-antitoxin system AbiEi family antitoxin domain-containing protein [Thermoplasmata archaeon]
MRNIEVLRALASKGNTFTINDAARETRLERGALKKMLFRMEKRGWIERIEKGKYLVIPLNAEKGRYTLHEFVIGSLLVDPHCIGYWSALNYYGFTEQIPATVFIQTTSRKKRQKINIFGVKYNIARLKKEKFFGINKELLEDSQINISDREKTIVDCLDKPELCGGIIEGAKALKNGKYSINKVLRYANRIGNTGVLRRLGYLSEKLSIDINVPKINTRNYLFLDPTMPHRGQKSSKWRLIVNLSDKELGSLE